MTKNDAIKIIEKVSGFTDDDSMVGEAWKTMLAEIDRLTKITATHEITAAYFPKLGELELTWRDIESGKAVGLTTKVDEKTGNKISDIVMPCVPHKAKRKDLY